MGKEKIIYSRYFLVRGLQTMWQDDPAKPGSLFREFVVTSNDMTSTQGTFQVYGLEGASAGIKDGNFMPSDAPPTVLFDKDFIGLDSAVKQFRQLIAEANEQGFQQMTMLDILEYEDKLRRSREGL